MHTLSRLSWELGPSGPALQRSKLRLTSASHLTQSTPLVLDPALPVFPAPPLPSRGPTLPNPAFCPVVWGKLPPVQFPLSVLARVFPEQVADLTPPGCVGKEAGVVLGGTQARVQSAWRNRL